MFMYKKLEEMVWFRKKKNKINEPKKTKFVESHFFIAWNAH